MSDRNERIAAAFDRLFRTYQQSDRGNSEELIRDRMERAAVYFEAVQPYEAQDIEEAVTNFLNGAAPGHNASFAPPAPLVGAECRRVMNLRLDHERRMRPYLGLPEPEVPPAEKARVAEGFKRLVAKLDKDAEPARVILEQRSREKAEANEKWLLGRGDLIEVKGSSFPVSQTLAKSLGYASHPNEQEHEHG